MTLFNDIKTAPYIINICRQPKTFIKQHAVITAITGMILIIIVLIIGLTIYLTDRDDSNERISKKSFGLTTMINTYMLFICLIIIWIVPVIILGIKYRVIQY